MCTNDVLKVRTGAQEEFRSEKGIMKKFLTLGVLTVALAAVSTPEAPAWLNWKIGIGANMGWQSGGNNSWWGLFRNGQPPAPESCGGGFGGGYPGPGLPGPGGPIPHTYYQPNSLEHGVAGAEGPSASSSNVPARTQSFSQPWSGQTVNYQYPYQYPYYYNYGYNSYYGYGR